MLPKDEDQDPLSTLETNSLEEEWEEREPSAGGQEGAITPSFVERETRRQKRMLRVFLALLMIPLILGVALLVFGRSDRQAVLDELRKQAPPIVRSEIQEQVRPAIQSEVKTQVTSSLGVISEIKERQESLTNEVNQIKSTNLIMTPEEIETIKRSSAIILQKEAEIRKLHERVELLEGKIKDRRFEIRPEDFQGMGKEATVPQKKPQ
jgi:signal transduction histidine kinase